MGNIVTLCAQVLGSSLMWIIFGNDAMVGIGLSGLSWLINHGQWLATARIIIILAGKVIRPQQCICW